METYCCAEAWRTETERLLGFIVRPGKDFDYLTYQLDLTVPVKIAWLDLATFIQVQYFSGYGESLLNYREKSDSLRFGIALVR